MKKLELIKIILLALAATIFLAMIYIEGDGLTFHRICVGLIGILELVVIMKVLTWFDRLAINKKWESFEIILKKIGIALGLMLTLFTIDRLINYTLNLYNLDYEITWTIIIPISILVVYLVKVLDIWAYANDQKNQNTWKIITTESKVFLKTRHNGHIKEISTVANTR